MEENDFREDAIYFPGDGFMVRAVHAIDWRSTPLGPIQRWPASIRAAVSISLNSNFQISVLSGPELVYIYNDATIPIFGDKHPWALGQRVADVWPEAWPTIGPMLEAVLETGNPTRHDDLLLVLNRAGFDEECYFTFSYSSIRLDEHTTDGVFVTTMETTRRVLSERRYRTLNELATQVALRRGDERTLELVRRSLAVNLYDLPFSALYLADAGTGYANQIFCTGLHEGCDGIAKRIVWSDADNTPAKHALTCMTRASEPQLFDADVLLAAQDVCGIWPERPRELLVLPLLIPGTVLPRGLLVVAINPRAQFDLDYRQFLETIGGLVATAVSGVDAIRAERQRAEAMVEMDRSKSQFFANASHELRTPVTLIRGPLADLLEHDAALPAGVRDLVEIAHRSAERMQKLVNSIMEFASIDAGRLPLRPVPVDVSVLTAEVASLFRSAMEIAGLRLSIRSTLPSAHALLDREMWETVVLNLLSNAYKFTQAGSIELTLELVYGARMFQLTVHDTGIGIAEDELLRVFQRFYRCGRLAGRPLEGSGIGLAMVRELVELHEGGIEVRSILGQGATFTVTLPWRPTGVDMPHAKTLGPVQTTEFDLKNAVESLGLPAAASSGVHISGLVAPTVEKPFRILVVDDNVDIVNYIARILHGYCVVESAFDAHSGLAAVRSFIPDLVLIDVMMPGTDGLELVRAIRGDSAICTVSLIVLSARAGPNARLDALAAGADEYLEKPFVGRELLARVNSHVRLTRIRRAAIEQEIEFNLEIAAIRNDLANVLEDTSEAFVSMDRELRIISLNPAAALCFGVPRDELIGRQLLEIAPNVVGTELERVMNAALMDGRMGSIEQQGPSSGRWFGIRCVRTSQGLIIFANDITERKEAERKLIFAKRKLERRVEARTEELRHANQLLAAVFDRAPGGIAITDTDGNFVRVNPAYESLVGCSEIELIGRRLSELIEPEDYAGGEVHLKKLLQGETESCQMEVRFRRRDGTIIWAHLFLSLIEDNQASPRYFVQIAKDITGRKRVEAQQHASQEELSILYQRLQTVRETERTALAREVHDQLGQTLSAAKIDLKLLENDIGLNAAPMPTEKIIRELRSACATLDRAMQLVREIATELRAPELDGQGLYAAIEWHARDFERRTRIKVEVGLTATLKQPSRSNGEALLRIFQEAMTNVLRHAHASQVWVSVELRADTLVLRVRDNGSGIVRRSTRANNSLGIIGMEERAALVGGTLRVGPVKPHGTLVSARIPINALNKRI